MLVAKSFITLWVFSLVQWLNCFAYALIIFNCFKNKIFKLLRLESSISNCNLKLARTSVLHKKVNAVEGAHVCIRHFIEFVLIQGLRLYKIYMDRLSSVDTVNEEPIFNWAQHRVLTFALENSKVPIYCCVIIESFNEGSHSSSLHSSIKKTQICCWVVWSFCRDASLSDRFLI